MPRTLPAQSPRAVSSFIAAAGTVLCFAVALLVPAASVRADLPAGLDPSLTFYTHGDPSGDEQYLLELANYARANPAAEGQALANVTDPEILRYYSHYNVSTSQLRSDFAGYKAQPPLAFNANLMASSRAQSLNQAANGFQGHNGTDGSTFDGRITATGYQWQALGENVYAYVENPLFGFVGMMTDWGVADLDHRLNIMSADASRPVFKETGISCVGTNKPGYGPLVVTEDFATPMTTTVPLLVGVVYDDTDGNAFYTSGEGIAGIVITSPQSTFYTITSASGGYTLPLDQVNGGSSIQVAFADGHGHRILRQMPCGNNVSDNIKADLVTSISNGSFSALSAVTMKNADRTTLKAGKIRIVRDVTDLSQALTVHYQVSGSAVAGQDYSLLQGWVSIPAGSSFATVKIRPLPASTTDDGSGDRQTVTITLESVDQDPLMAMGATQASLKID